MNIEDKKSELAELIDQYLHSLLTYKDLSDYSWVTIEYFVKNKNKLPRYEDDERVFWYAIWQIQHLADPEHEEDGTLGRALEEIKEYLTNERKLPACFEGRRPED